MLRFLAALSLLNCVLLSVGHARLGEEGPSIDVGATILPGEAFHIDVPSGAAEMVVLTLEPNQVGEFTGRLVLLTALRDGEIVGRRRIVVSGGYEVSVRQFPRLFDQLRIATIKRGTPIDVVSVRFCGGEAHPMSDCRSGGRDPIDVEAAGNGEPRITTSSTVFPARPGPPSPSQQAPAGGAESAPVSNSGATETAPAATADASTSGGAVSVPDAPETRLDWEVGVPQVPPSQDVPTGGNLITIGGGEDLPFHGEATPIRSYDDLIPSGQQVLVQAGINNGAWQTSHPWRNQAKVMTTWVGLHNARVVRESRDVTMAANGMPIFSTSDRSADRYYRNRALLWAGGSGHSYANVHGTWRATAGAGSKIRLSAFHADYGGMTVLRATDQEVVYRCDQGANCQHNLEIIDAEPGAEPPTIVQISNGFGQPVDDALRDELVTREVWRRANFGYGVLRTMDMSGATHLTASTIRFDDFPDIDHAVWHEWGARLNVNGRLGYADLNAGTGAQRTFTPVEARLRAASELGAIYHHNFPHLFLEHRERVRPSVIGEWFEEFWDDPNYSEDAKLSVLNDYELQHVDEFAALVVENQAHLVENTVVVEVSNETWNWANPYFIQLTYFQRKAEDRAREMGRDVPEGLLQAIGTGYATAQMVARLRKVAPEIEWRGVMAVQTTSISDFQGEHYVSTESGYNNITLREMMRGWDLFWQDYAANEATWSSLYAPRPASPGDWLEAQGTTYFGLDARNAEGERVLAGMTRAALEARVADPAEWPALRSEVMQWFLTGQGVTNSLSQMRLYFVALAETAAAYGMEVASYEGGNHASPGADLLSAFDQIEGLDDFWFDFSHGVEIALIQAAVHDAAVDAGWKSIADYSLFQGANGAFIFGTRQNFDDISPRYCEYARWMSARPAVPAKLAHMPYLATPYEKCGGLIDYFARARNENYYLGQSIPSQTRFLERVASLR